MVFYSERALRFCFDINPILTGKGRLSLPPARPGFLQRPTGPPRMRRRSQPARSGRSESSSGPSPSRRGCPAPRGSAVPRGKQLREGLSSLQPPGRVAPVWRRGQKNHQNLSQLFPVGASREGTSEGKELLVPAASLPRVIQPI